VTPNRFAGWLAGYGITETTIPNTISNLLVTSIGDNAFFNFGDGAFAVCTNLTTVTVSTNNPAYCSVAGVLFDRGQTVLVQYPGGKSGTWYTVTTGITDIRRFAFHSCFSLTGVTIPDSVTNIEEGAFAYCTGFTSVTIGNNVTSIGSNAFNGCRTLANVYFKGNAPSNEPSVFFGVNSMTVYYMPGTTNWGSAFGGRPTVLWNPHTQSDANFGVRTNGFGFTISGSTNLVIVTETCTNLTNPVWSTRGTNSLTWGSSNSTSYFSDSGWTNSPCRFYRFRSS